MFLETVEDIVVKRSTSAQVFHFQNQIDAFPAEGCSRKKKSDGGGTTSNFEGTTYRILIIFWAPPIE